MAQLPFCLYLPKASGTPCCDQNAATFQRFHDVIQDWSKGRVGADNFDQGTFSDSFYFRKRPNKPPIIEIPALEPSDTDPHIEQKPPASGTTKFGLDLYVDPSSTAYGMVGVVDVRDSAKTQRYDIIIDSYTAASPGATLKTPTGAHTLDTGGAFDVIFKRNGSEQGRFDGTNLLLPAARVVSWTDAGIGRNAAGIVEFNSGTAGTLRSLLVRGGNAIGIYFGGATSADAALKYDGTSRIRARLGDDSGSVSLTAGSFISSGDSIECGNTGLNVGSSLAVNFSSTTGYNGTIDLRLNRSAAGKLLLSDPSGGVTTPSLNFGAGDVGLERRTASVLKVTDGSTALGVIGADNISELNGTGLAPGGLWFVGKDSGTAKLNLPSGGSVNWSSSATDQGSGRDTGLARNAAGIVEVNNGTAGTYRDLRVRYLGVGVAPSSIYVVDADGAAMRASELYIRDGTNLSMILSGGLPGVHLASDQGINFYDGADLETATGDAGFGRGASERLDFTATVAPQATNARDLGTSSLAWKELYARKIDTDGAQTLTIQRNDVDHMTFNGSVNVPVALSATGSTTTGDTRIVRSNQTASNGGSYSVAATVGLVFIDASALTAAQNFTINLPSPVTYDQRVISVKVSVVGAATSTITIDSDAGNVEGAATQVWSASIRSGATFYSNGTDWFEVGQIGVA